MGDKRIKICTTSQQYAQESPAAAKMDPLCYRRKENIKFIEKDGMCCTGYKPCLGVEKH